MGWIRWFWRALESTGSLTPTCSTPTATRSESSTLMDSPCWSASMTADGCSRSESLSVTESSSSSMPCPRAPEPGRPRSNSTSSCGSHLRWTRRDASIERRSRRSNADMLDVATTTRPAADRRARTATRLAGTVTVRRDVAERHEWGTPASALSGRSAHAAVAHGRAQRNVVGTRGSRSRVDQRHVRRMGIGSLAAHSARRSRRRGVTCRDQHQLPRTDRAGRRRHRTRGEAWRRSVDQPLACRRSREVTTIGCSPQRRWRWRTVGRPMATWSRRCPRRSTPTHSLRSALRAHTKNER